MGDGVPDLTETTNMDSMFYGANLFTDGTAFGGWDVSGVTNMKRMFKETIVNGGGLGNWDVSGVTDMESMFHGAPSLTEGLGDWDVSGSTNMAAMFRNATTTPTAFVAATGSPTTASPTKTNSSKVVNGAPGLLPAPPVLAMILLPCLF